MNQAAMTALIRFFVFAFVALFTGCGTEPADTKAYLGNGNVTVVLSLDGSLDENIRPLLHTPE